MKKVVVVVLGIVIVLGAWFIFATPTTDTMSVFIKGCALFMVVGVTIGVVRKLRSKKQS